MYHPPRGGVRGGKDQFNWEDVKADKHRENYLGHSLKAPVGRWQKGKDLHWYAREKKSDVAAEDELRAELRRVKEEEEQQMMEALGLAPKRDRRPQGGAQLEKREMEELFRRGKAEDDGPSGALPDVDRVKGLGFAPAALYERLPGKAVPKVEAEGQAPLEGDKEHTQGPPRTEGVTERAATARPSSGSESESLETTEERRERKRRRKEEKRERKARRKEEKRESKKARREEESGRGREDCEDRKEGRRDESRGREGEGRDRKDRGRR